MMIRNFLSLLGLMAIVATLNFAYAQDVEKSSAVGAVKLSLNQDSFSDKNNGGQIKHVFLSLIIPGAGELAAGHKKAAKFFIGSEVTLWIGYFATHQYIGILKDDLKAYAARHAGVNTAGKDDQYWIDVGFSSSIYAFNDERLLDRDLEGVYPEQQGFEWQWDSEENRVSYAGKRLNRVDWKRRTTFITGGLVLNHLISAVDVIRIIRKEKNSQSRQRQSYLQLNYGLNESQGEVYQLSFTMKL